MSAVFDRLSRLWEEPQQKEQLGQDPRSVREENIVWIFGTGRSGSTWLGSMMADIDACAMWNEPLVGKLFGNFYYSQVEDKAGKAGRHFILGEPYREIWLKAIRDLVLGEATAGFPEVAGKGYLVIKEPNGSRGAPLIMEALPESRMIFLIRDPRDVVASSMDARREGGWLHERRDDRGRKAEKNPNAYVRMRANTYVQQIQKTRQAYEPHRRRKVLVRYEELRKDTLGTMRRIYSALKLPVDDEELVRAVEKHAWENIPEEDKGPGKIRRKATTGRWHEDLTSAQVRIVENLTHEIIEEFYG
jgi:hypothetical protein